MRRQLSYGDERTPQYATVRHEASRTTYETKSCNKDNKHGHLDPSDRGRISCCWDSVCDTSCQSSPSAHCLLPKRAHIPRVDALDQQFDSRFLFCTCPACRLGCRSHVESQTEVVPLIQPRNPRTSMMQGRLPAVLAVLSVLNKRRASSISLTPKFHEKFARNAGNST